MTDRRPEVDNRRRLQWSGGHRRDGRRGPAAGVRRVHLGRGPAATTARRRDIGTFSGAGPQVRRAAGGGGGRVRTRRALAGCAPCRLAGHLGRRRRCFVPRACRRSHRPDRQPRQRAPSPASRPWSRAMPRLASAPEPRGPRPVPARHPRSPMQATRPVPVPWPVPGAEPPSWPVPGRVAAARSSPRWASLSG